MSAAQVNASQFERTIPFPSELKERLDGFVYGNEQTKEYLSSVVFKHLHMTKTQTDLGSRSHTLVMGSTGSGKSHLVSGLQRVLDVPVVSIDATTLTEAGYQGRDVDSIFEDLLQISNYDRMRAESGIVFVDEFDKLEASGGGDRDIRGRGVQNSLLRMLDGDVRQIKTTRTSRFHTGEAGETVLFDTRRLLFIFAGAFSGHPELTNGDSVSPEQIANAGFIPELVSRIPNVLVLRELQSTEIADVLSKESSEIFKEYKSLFQALGCDLKISDRGAEQVARSSVRMRLGFRGVRTVLDRALLPMLAEFESENQQRLSVILDCQNGKDLCLRVDE